MCIIIGIAIASYYRVHEKSDLWTAFEGWPYILQLLQEKSQGQNSSLDWEFFG